MAGARVLVCTFFHHLLNFFVLRMNFLFCHHSIHHYFCCCKFPFKEIQDIVWIPHPSPWKTFKASEPPPLSKRWIFTFIGNLFFVISVQPLPLALAKDQFFSELIYEVIVSPKIQTKNGQDFCHHYTGQKSWQFLVRILGETMTS